jgi:hypothetical protein
MDNSFYYSDTTKAVDLALNNDVHEAEDPVGLGEAQVHVADPVRERVHAVLRVAAGDPSSVPVHARDREDDHELGHSQLPEDDEDRRHEIDLVFVQIRLHVQSVPISVRHLTKLPTQFKHR